MDLFMKELPSEELLCQLIQEVKIEDNKNQEKEFCHLCGHSKKMHSTQSHQFILATDEYKCITCGMWFYQHLIKKANCYDEYIRG